MTEIIARLADISARYDALFVDLWGCVHDGVTALPEAVAALQAFRKGGGAVVLVTNSPKPRAGVAEQLKVFGVPDDAWDSIASSGDSARAAMFRGVVGQKVFFMGEWERDAGFFEPLNLLSDPVEISRVPLEEAEGIICCGPFDPMADPEVNRPQFLYAKQKGMKLLCANPDIVVDRGEVREWCAGALAALYTEMGGESLYFGKPYPPIYDLARRRLGELGRDVPDARILAIGDGPATDVSGAMGEDLDVIFITGGLAARETKTERQPDAAALKAYLGAQSVHPQFAMGHLR
ncbi:TIGR01459 family HAD-type hydrolase [Poseidonocella sedimentorum]|uniref:HAD-superfamily class IIA hydrolase, TIGR01459 n=1 Tax=Poseidonocella sedimentorum TaxID=871652 RepID=A0A1I6DI64_9RHOB|nr:TIGR01459 family HAD-type hydrolase [Poseidonocella sedimentorum]SFR05071.1 HAD-superfamily class IIA hydrolase, TIGR01459 [Poseidonocella sedimentorum]